MTFEEWYRVNLKAKHENYFGAPSQPIDDVKAAWNYQQRIIDETMYDLNHAEKACDRLQERIDELEQWIAAIADNHPQIPDWIQQSARSLLAQEQA